MLLTHYVQNLRLSSVIDYSHLESELSGVVVHAATEHEGEHVPDAIPVEDLFSGRRTEAAVGQRRAHHRQRVRVHLHGARLETSNIIFKTQVRVVIKEKTVR
jgi:hypothetical protein